MFAIARTMSRGWTPGVFAARGLSTVETVLRQTLPAISSRELDIWESRLQVMRVGPEPQITAPKHSLQREIVLWNPDYIRDVGVDLGLSSSPAARLRAIDTVLASRETDADTSTQLEASVAMAALQFLGYPFAGHDLSGTTLRFLNLRGANLQRAVLTDARLFHCLLTQAYLPGASLAGVVAENTFFQRLWTVDAPPALGDALPPPRMRTNKIIDMAAPKMQADSGIVVFASPGVPADKWDFHIYEEAGWRFPQQLKYTGYQVGWWRDITRTYAMYIHESTAADGEWLTPELHVLNRQPVNSNVRQAVVESRARLEEGHGETSIRISGMSDVPFGNNDDRVVPGFLVRDFLKMRVGESSAGLPTGLLRIYLTNEAANKNYLTVREYRYPAVDAFSQEIRVDLVNPGTFAVSSDGEYLVVGGAAGTGQANIIVYRWDTLAPSVMGYKMRPSSTPTLATSDEVTKVLMSGEGDCVVAHRGGDIERFRLSDGMSMGTVRIEDDAVDGHFKVKDAALVANEKALAVLNEDGDQVYVFDLETMRQIESIKPYSWYLTGDEYSDIEPDKKIAAIAPGPNGDIYLATERWVVQRWRPDLSEAEEGRVAFNLHSTSHPSVRLIADGCDVTGLEVAEYERRALLGSGAVEHDMSPGPESDGETDSEVVAPIPRLTLRK